MLFARNQALDMLNVADDRIQGGIRRGLYGQQPDGSYDNEGLRKLMGEAVHIPRSEYLPSEQWQLAANRGVQYGAMGAGVTAAGSALVDLTHAFAEQFGGSGDQTTSGTLYM